MRLIDADILPRHGERGGLVYWKDIEDAPTIDRPQVEWIPCSERLPSDGQYVIIQYYDTTGKNHVSVVGAFYDDRQGFVDTGYGDMWFGNGNDDVIAWLSLPGEKMSNQRVIDWIPIRERKPHLPGIYLVTAQVFTGDILSIAAYFTPNGFLLDGVIAWAEMPAVWTDEQEQLSLF